MLWLFLTIAAYALFAAVSLGDKYFLSSGQLSDPKLYAFYVGMLGLFIFLGVPIWGLPTPSAFALLIAVATGCMFLFGQYFLYLGLHRYEASRIVPATGALIPLFTYFFGSFFFQGASLSVQQFIALLLLMCGSVIMTWRSAKHVLGANLGVAIATSVFFGASFALAKLAYNSQSFWSAFFWIRIGGSMMALFFLFSGAVRKELEKSFTFKTHKAKRRDTLFMLNQVGGGTAAVLQNFAVATVPTALVAFVLALQGVEYVFLFFFSLLISLRYPRAKVHELVSTTTVEQKALAICVIALGIALFTLG